jgi:hypothetical protein
VRHVGGVVLEGAEIRIAAALVDIAVRHLERTDGAAPAAVREFRDRLTGFAAETRDDATTSGSTAQGFARESEMPDITLIVADSPVQMTVRDVAGLLGISGQAVRALCRSGSLTAVRSRAGWEIDERSAAALAASRKGT